MNTNNKYYFKILPIFIVANLLITSSCKKHLDIPNPSNSMSSASLNSSKAVMDAFRTGIYFNLSGWIGGNGTAFFTSGFRYFEGFADNGYNPTSLFNYSQINNSDPTTGVVVLNWNNMYTHIYNINLLLESLANANAGVLTSTQLATYIGEAKTLRALYYYYLVRYYGGVPLILSTTDPEINTKGRTGVATIYAQIEKDLTDAVSTMPATKISGAQFYINNKYIPESILADVYLTEGKWASAETAASDVINSGLYTATTPDKVFLQTSPETIWAWGNVAGFSTYSANPSFTKGSMFNFVSPVRTAPYLPTSQSKNFESGTLALSPNLLSAFETTGDLRYINWVALSNFANYANPNNRYFAYKLKYNLFNADEVIPNGKEENFIYTRLSEVYLIRAEARAQQNNLTGAATDLNFVRTNHGGLAATTSTSQADLIAAILKERQVELFFEKGNRWWDLVRTRTANAVLSAISYKTSWALRDTLFPLTQVIINANPNLTQTPGY